MGNWERKWKEKLRNKHSRKLQRIRAEFLPEVLEIVEKPASPLGHFTIFTIGMIIVIFGLWSVLGRVDEIVTARGRLVTVSGVQIVQTVQGGRVQKICVNEGDFVNAGDPIIILEATEQKLALQDIQNRLELTQFENDLLSSILNGVDISDLIDREDREDKIKIYNYVSAIQDEYIKQREELINNLEQFKIQETIEQNTLQKLKDNKQYLKKQEQAFEEISAGSNENQINMQQLELQIQELERQVDDYESLYEVGVIAKVELTSAQAALQQLKLEYEIQVIRRDYSAYDTEMTLLELQNQIVLIGKDIETQEAAIILLQTQQDQVQKSIESLESRFIAEISGLIVDNQEAIESLRTNQELQSIYVSEQKIVSPVDGVVMTVDVNTIGGVLMAAQQVASIIPNDSSYLAEIAVANRDIGQLNVGQEVELKLDAYNFQKYGKLQGTIVMISPDAELDPIKGWVYKVQVAIKDGDIGQDSILAIDAGMEVTAEIKIDQRRIIDFFLEPIVDYFDGSLKIR